uniref:Uncharacterized protein n=1 Tax=Glossina pallidipes TaxID=7398 RepID=A0A1B0A898_GLOPL
MIKHQKHQHQHQHQQQQKPHVVQLNLALKPQYLSGNFSEKRGELRQPHCNALLNQHQVHKSLNDSCFKGKREDQRNDFKSFIKIGFNGWLEWFQLTAQYKVNYILIHGVFANLGSSSADSSLTSSVSLAQHQNPVLTFATAQAISFFEKHLKYLFRKLFDREVLPLSTG